MGGRLMGALAFATEPASRVLADAQPLFAAHWREVGQAHPLKPATQRYLAIDRHGGLLACTARRDGELVGYAVFFLLYHWHYNDWFVAQNDIIFLRDDARRGTAAIRLMDYARAELKQRGVQKIYWHVKRAHDWTPLLERRGAVLEEYVMGEELH